MKNPNIVKIVALTLMVGALMPIRANANSGDRYVSNDTERPSNGAIHDYATAKDPTIITFDVTGAGTDAFQGTVPSGIAPDRSIVGFIRDAGVPSGTSRRGFLRDKNGTTTVFDAPGAGTDDFEGTRACQLSAHAKVDERTGELLFFDYGPARSNGNRPAVLTSLEVRMREEAAGLLGEKLRRPARSTV